MKEYYAVEVLRWTEVMVLAEDEQAAREAAVRCRGVIQVGSGTRQLREDYRAYCHWT